jgi:hypothetical protein
LAIAFHLFAAPWCVFIFSSAGVVEKVIAWMGDLANALAERNDFESRVNMAVTERGWQVGCRETSDRTS